MRRLRNPFKKISIRKTLAIYILLFILLPALLVSMLIYTFSYNIVKQDYTSEYLDSIYAGFEYNMESFFNHLNTLSFNILSYQELYNLLLDESVPPENKTGQIEQILSNFLSPNSAVKGIEIHTYSGESYCYMHPDIDASGKPPYEQYQPALAQCEKIAFRYCSTWRSPDLCNYLVFGKKYYHYTNRYDLGYLLFHVEEPMLHAIYKENTEASRLFFITLNQQIISHPEAQRIGATVYMPILSGSNDGFTTENGEYMFSKTPVTCTALKDVLEINGVFSYEELNRTFQNLNMGFSLLLSILIIGSLAIAVFSSRRFIQGLLSLNNAMNEFVAEEKTAPVILKGISEVTQLSTSFEALTKRIDSLMKKNKQIMEKQKTLELNALQAQINPHFIYNTLDNISWTLKLKGNEDVADIIHALGTFFRISLHDGKTIISIETELEHVRNYLLIEKIRFPHLFEVTFDIDPNILPLQTLKLILQPLVENAISHGFENIDYMGLITIRGFLDGDDICFIVSDNGRGMDFDPLKKEEETSQDHFRSGYGIYNVNERLVLEYGERYGLSYQSTPNHGTTVTILIKNTGPYSGPSVI